MAQSEEVEVGYRTVKFGNQVLSEPTGEKPESKLWWNDGRWWGSLWNPDEERYEIHWMDLDDQEWHTTDTEIDDRGETLSDILWDETDQKLYVVSHYFTSESPGPTSTSNEARLFRFSYDSGSQTYSLDSGYPVQVNQSKSETLVLTKDSTGKLWVNWTEDGDVFLNCSQGSDHLWGDPFVLPSMDRRISDDDISSIISFGGNKVGVLWSNQDRKTMFFSYRNDGDPDNIWQEEEVVLKDNDLGNIADDHINLATVCDDNGNIYAVTKTSLHNNLSDPLVYVLRREPGGDWDKFLYGTVIYDLTRAIMVIDNENEQLYVFAASDFDNGNQDAIYYKVTDLDDIDFEGGLGEPFILSEDNEQVNNPTSTKQCVNGRSGLLVMASDKSTRHYLHNFLDINRKPIVTSFSPEIGPANTVVTLNGKLFSGATHVVFNGTPTNNFVVVSSTEIQVVVPPGANSGPITVLNDEGGTPSEDEFTVTIPPFDLNIFVNGPGSVDLDPPGGSYSTVTDVTVTAVADEGFVFAGWEGALEGFQNPQNLTMYDDQNLIARFVEDFSGEFPELEETVSGTAFEEKEVSTDQPVTKVNYALYLAAISNQDNEDVESVTGLGLEWTPVDIQCGGRGNIGLELWMAQGNPYGDGTVTAKFDRTPDGSVIVVSRYSKVDFTNPIGSIVSANTNGINGDCEDGDDHDRYSFDIQTTNNASVVYAAVGTRHRTHDPRNNFIEHIEVASGTSSNDAGIAIIDKEINNPATVEVEGDLSSNVDYAVIAVEIRKGSGGTGGELYSLTVNQTGQGTINISPDKPAYENGETVILTADPADGYRFNFWEGAASGTETLATLTIDDDTEVSGHFLAQYTLDITTAGQGLVQLVPDIALYDSATVVAFNATPEPGYRFVGWSGDTLSETPSIVFSMNSSKSLTATFVPVYTINTNIFGFGSVSFDPPPLEGGVFDSATVVTMTAVPDSGNNFVGWSGDHSSQDAVTLVEMDGPKDINATFADWTSQIFQLTIEQNGPGNIIMDPPGGLYAGGTVVTITALPNPDYAFTGWSGDYDGLQNPLELLINENKDLTADFFPRFTLDVTSVGTGVVNIDPPGGVYDSATVVQLTAIPQPGFIFTGWTGDYDDTENPKNVVMDASKAVTAVFATEHSVMATVQEGGRIIMDPAGGIYGAGTEVTFSALPDPGYIFDQWSGDFGGNQNPQTVTIQSDLNISAEFTTLDALDLDSLLDISISFADAQLRNSVEEIEDFDRFPRATPDNTTWETKSPNEWLSGFFPGALWNMYELSGHEDFRGWAESWTQELENQKNDNDNHEIGFKVFLSFGKGYEMTGNEEYKAIVLEAAETMAGSFNDEVGGIQSWNRWHLPITIESLSTLEMLIWASKNGGQAEWYDMAVSHGLKVREDFIREDGSVFEIIDYDENDGHLIDEERDRSHSTETTWAAGQAWAIQGFTMLYRETGDSRFLEAAQQVADYFINNLPNDFIPYWDFNAPLIPDTDRDVTAAAIASLALQELSSFVTDPFSQLTYQTTAFGMLQALSAPPYIAEGSGSSGILLHAVRNHPDSRDVDVSLIYADYYYLESVRRFKSQPTVLYDLTMNLSGSGTVTLDPPGNSYPSGAEVTITASPEFRWEFSGWSGDLSGVTNPVTVTMDADKEITAIFTENTNQVVLFTDIIGSGNIILNPPGGIYEKGTTVMLSAIPTPGGLFDGWGGILSGTDNPQSIVMNEDVNVSATFISRYTLSVDEDPNGIVIISPELEYYDDGAAVTLIALPENGYRFNSWGGDLSGNDNPATLIIDGDKTVDPLFIPDAATHLETYTGTAEDEVEVSTSGDVPASEENFYLAAITTRNHFEVSSVSGLGLTWTQVKAQCAGRNQVNAELWMAAGTPAQDGPVTAHFASDPPRAVIAVSVYTGVDLTDPIGSIVSYNTKGIDGGCSGGSDADEYSFNITPESAGSIIYAAAATRDESHSPGPGYTEHAEDSENSGSRKVTLAIMDQALIEAIETPVEGTLSDQADLSIIAVEIKGGGGTSTSPLVSLTAQINGSGSLTVTPDPITGTPPGGIYNVGEIVTISATPEPGYEFTGWSGDLSGADNPATLTLDSDKNISAIFEIPPLPEFMLTITTIGSGTVALDPDPNSQTATEFVYFQDTEISLTAVPAAGFEFAGWGNHLSGNNITETLTMNADKNVLAIFAQLPPEEYSLAVSATGPGTFSIDPPGGIYIEGTEVTITPLPDEGYEFSGWSGDQSGSQDPLTITMDGDKNISGAFTELPPQFYTITTHTVGSGILVVSPDQPSYAEGTTIMLIAAPFSGYEFVGWSGDASGTNNQSVIVMDSNKDVTAVFLEVGQPHYALNINPIGEGSVALNPPGGYYNGGTVVSMTAAPDNGYLFGGWSGDVSGTSNPQSITMNSDRTVLVAFTEIPTEQYTLSVSNVGSGSISLNPPGGSYDPGTVVTVTATPASGYLFTTWSGDLGGAANPQSITMNANKNVTGVFIEEPTEQFSVSVSAVGAGNISMNPPGGVYDAGTVVSFTATADNGHQFSAWGGDMSGTANPQTLTINSDKNIVAIFEEIPTEEFTLQLTTSGSGSVTMSPEGGIYSAGTVVTLTPVPAANYQFGSWGGDLTGSTAPTTITMNSNKTVSAAFTEISGEQFTLGVLPIGSGSVTMDPPGGTYTSGMTVTLTGKPDPGYQFGGWGGDLSGTGNPKTITVDSDKNVIAAFTALPAGVYSLSVTKTGSGNVTMSPSGGTYAGGTVVTVTATPDNGFEFNGWSGDVSSTDNPLSVTMTAHTQLVADFSSEQQEQFTLTTTVTGSGNVVLSPAGGVYDPGTVVTVSAVPGSGYQFNAWSGGAVSSDNPLTITMDGNKAISAEFTELPPSQFALTTAVSGSGSITLSPPGGVYDAGTVVTVTATADAGNLFSGWGGDLTGSLNPQTVTMTADHNITAAFIVDENGGGGGNGPVVFEELQSGGASLGMTASTSAPISLVSGNLYLAAISSKNPRDVVSVTGLGLSWSRIRAQCSARGQTGVEVWMAIGSPSGDGIVTATVDRETDNIIMVVSRYSGVDTSDPIGDIVSGNTLGQDGPCSGGTDNTAYSFNLSTSTNNAIVYGAIAHRNRHNTPGAGYSQHGEYQQNGTTGGSIAGMSIQEQSVASPTTLPFDGTLNRNVDWAVAAFEIRAGGGAGGGTTQHALTMNTIGSGTITGSPAGTIFDEGSVVTLSATPDAGFEFAGWSGDLTGNTNPAAIVMDSDKSVTATFTEIQIQQFTLTTNVAGNGAVALAPAGGVYAAGTVVTITALPGAGHQFDNWSGAATGVDNPLSVTVDSNLAITANFSEIIVEQYILTTQKLGEGEIILDPAGGVYGAGTVVTITAAPASGHQFNTWSGDLGGTTNPATITMDSEKTVTAVFTELPPGQFNLAVNLVGDGSMTLDPPGGVYTDGTTVTVTALPGAGFQFDQWSGDLSGSVNPATIVVDSEKAVTATFSEIPVVQYTLNVNVAGAGTVALSPAGGVYDVGTVVTLSASPNSGNTFSGWGGDLSGTSTPATITMDGNKTVSAAFASDGGGGSGGGPVVREETASGGASLNTSVSTEAPVAGVAGDLYLAAISSREPVDVLSVSGLGLNWSLLRSQCAARDKENIYIFQAMGNPTGNGVVTAQLGESTDNAVIIVTRYSGVDQSNPIGQIISGNTLGLNGPCSDGVDNAAYSFQITTSTDNGMVFGAIAHRNRRNEPGAGYTEYHDKVQDGTTGGQKLSMSVQEQSVASPSTIAFDGTLNRNVDWVVVAMEIRSGGSSGGGTTQYSLNTNTIGSGSISVNPVGSVFDEGATISLTAVPDPGFEFSGWSGDVSGNANPTSITMDGNKTVTATFVETQAQQFTLTTNVSGDGSVTLSPPGGTYNAGTQVTVTASPDAGFEFANWSGDASGNSNPLVITMDANKSLTAAFTEIQLPQFTLTTNTQGNGSVTATPSAGTYDAGSEVILTASPQVGYDFSGWSGDLSGSDNPAVLTMDGNKSVTAIFTEVSTEQYTLTIVTIGDGSVTLSPAGGVYTAGTQVTLTAMPDAGFQFSTWGGSISDTNNPVTVTMTSDLSIAAAFVEAPPEQFTVTVSASGSGTVTLSPSGGTYAAGTVVTASASAASGFQFNGWSGDLSGTTNPASFTVDGNKGITAEFIDVNTTFYTLNTLPVGSGSIALDPPGGTYAEGTVVTANAVPDAGFQFSGWGGDLSGFANPQTLTMNGNKTVIAAFTELPQVFFTLSTTVNGPGSISLNPAGGVYQIGTVVTVTAVPDAGATFDGWSGDLSGGSATETITMSSDKSLTASFREDTGGGGGSGGPVVYEGTVSGGATEMNVVSTAGNVSAVSGDLYLATVVTKNLTGVLSVQGMGLTWSLVKAQCSGRSMTGVEVWMAMGTPSGDDVVSANLASSPSNSIIAVSRYSGVDNLSPLGAVLSGNTLGIDGACSGGVDIDSYAFNFTTTTDGAYLFGAVALRNRRHTPGAGFTEQDEIVQDGALGGDKATLAIQDREVASPATVSLAGIFNKNVDWAVIGLEIRPGSSNNFAFLTSDGGKIGTAINASMRSGNTDAGFGRNASGSEGATYYWRFNVSGIENRLIKSAKLRIFTENSGEAAMSVYTASNYFADSRTAWSSSDLTENNAPAVEGNALSVLSTRKSDGWTEFDVAAAIDGSGEISFALAADKNADIQYLAGVGENPPQLVIELESEAVQNSEPGDDVVPAAGASLYSTGDVPVLLNQTAALPEELRLGANYPEPFNAETTIEYALPADARVRLEVFNVLGQRIRTLVDDVQAAGLQRISWESKDEYGNEVASGIYFIQLSVGGEKLVGKMTLQK